MEPEIKVESFVHNLVLKRKRRQRQRSLSSSDDAFPMTTSSSAPSELLLIGSSKEEEEDQEVAMCLILLAQGLGDYQTECNSSPPNEMLSGRKMDGLGLYECKPCNQFFHSFQALGGHRASHKKLKVTTTDDKHMFQKSTPDNSSCHNLIPVRVPQLGNKVRAGGKIRVHQCLICCAEFPSGQALGGHMRKHRVNIPLTHTFTTETMTIKAEDGLSVTLSLSSPAHTEAEIETSESFQCLDLNFPAAASDEMSGSTVTVTKFSFTSKEQQQSQSLQDSGLVLAGPALVECHY